MRRLLRRSAAARLNFNIKEAASGGSSSLEMVFLSGQALIAQLLPSRLIIAAHRTHGALFFSQRGRIDAPALLHSVAMRYRCAEIGGRAASFLFARRGVVHTRCWFDA